MENNGILPKSRLEAMRYNRYKGYKWDWYPIHVWPRRLATAVVTGKWNKDLELGLFVFLVGNGMEPAKARDVLLENVSGKARADQAYQLYDELYKNVIPTEVTGT